MLSKLKTYMLLSFVFALIVACTKEGVINTGGDASPSTVNKTTLLQLVNDVRQRGCQCGDVWYPPTTTVTWNTQLEQAAYNHSKDMYEKKYFSHDAPDGTDAGDRLNAVGYKWSSYAENIGQGYSSEAAVIQGWLNSPGHCRNIMGRSYKEMGVARVGSYWTMVLASN